MMQAGVLPWWHLHRRLYDWVLSFAHCRHATAALFFLSFIESLFFPIAPDFFLIALCLEHRQKSWFYALMTTVASVIGGVVAYWVGATVWHHISSFFFQHIFSEQLFHSVGQVYREWGFWAIFTAAFTPVPYKVFTITAGVFEISFLKFILASLIGRGARFFLVATLIWFFGQSVRRFIDKYFNLITLAVLAVLLGAFFLLN